MQKYIFRLLILMFLSLSAAGSIISQGTAQAKRDMNVVPMPIVVDYFYVYPSIEDGQAVLAIEWQTSIEVGVSGYYVWRSTTHTFDDAVPISPFFEAKGNENADGMAHYAYLDSQFYSDVCYTYWFQEVQESDEAVFHGPMSYPVISNGITPCRKLHENYPVYLPIIEQ